jgi:hypothetical protein
VSLFAGSIDDLDAAEMQPPIVIKKTRPLLTSQTRNEITTRFKCWYPAGPGGKLRVGPAGILSHSGGPGRRMIGFRSSSAPAPAPAACPGPSPDYWHRPTGSPGACMITRPGSRSSSRLGRVRLGLSPPSSSYTHTHEDEEATRGRLLIQDTPDSVISLAVSSLCPAGGPATDS